MSEISSVHTPMVHYVCDCGMTSTCVVTPAAEKAWSDHMDSHQLPMHYTAHTWTAITLPFINDPEDFPHRF